MKKVYLLATTLFSVVAFAQITAPLGKFTKLRVYDKLDVELIPSEENKAVITGVNENDVQVILKNEELKLRMPTFKMMSGEDIKIKLYYTDLNDIDASEGSEIYSNSDFNSKSVSLNAKEGSNIVLKIIADNVNLRAVTGAVLEVSGTTSTLDASLGSGGAIDGIELTSDSANISITTGGEASIFAKTLVNAKIKAGGTINIYGKPKKINKSVVLGGTIKEK